MRIDEIYNMFAFLGIPVVVVTIFRLGIIQSIRNKEKYKVKNSFILTIGLYTSGIWVLVTLCTFIIDMLYYVRVYFF